ncbi:MAG TPA: hypothetical protein VJG90_01170 [Candidatus Nanoarchaeia archaeon]|nr:hypothetical protein [Candidatus Nanoarchaeia archaeon]
MKGRFAIILLLSIVLVTVPASALVDPIGWVLDLFSGNCGNFYYTEDPSCGNDCTDDEECKLATHKTGTHGEACYRCNQKCWSVPGSKKGDGFKDAACRGSCESPSVCKPGPKENGCFYCMHPCEDNDFLNDPQCGNCQSYRQVKCMKVKDVPEGTCYRCMGCGGGFPEDSTCGGTCKARETCKGELTRVHLNPLTGEPMMCYRCFLENCPEGTFTAEDCEACGLNRKCEPVGYIGSLEKPVGCYQCGDPAKCPEGYSPNYIVCRNCLNGGCETKMVSTGFLGLDNTFCYKCKKQCPEGMYTDDNKLKCYEGCEKRGMICDDNGQISVGVTSCFPCTCGWRPSSMAECEKKCERGFCIPRGECFECKYCPSGEQKIKEDCEKSCAGTCVKGESGCFKCQTCSDPSKSLRYCQRLCKGSCIPSDESNLCFNCMHSESSKPCPEGSSNILGCKQTCEGSCVPLAQRKECAVCMHSETPPPCPESSMHILACKQGCEGSCIPLKERSDCAVCMRSETPPPCPETSVHILACKQSCDGTCMPLKERNDCAQCVRTETSPVPPPCPEGTSAGTNCLQSCNGYCAAHPERKDCARCMSCSEWCSWKGYSATSIDYSAQIAAELNSLRCVSGIRIQHAAGIRSERCTCYSTEKPQISVDSTPPICETPCGPVKCDSSTTCSCGEGCTMTASCGWGGWKRSGDGFTAVVGGSSQSSDSGSMTGQAIRYYDFITGNTVMRPSGKY